MKDYQQEIAAAAHLLMKDVLPLKDQRFVDSSKISAIANKLNIRDDEARIYFLRELHNIVRKLPLKIYNDYQTRQSVLTAMSWVDDVLADFGRNMGLDGLAFNDANVVSLKFEVLGDLFIERIEDAVLVYVMREVPQPSKEIYAAALELCHWRHNHPFAVNAALKDDRHLIFAVNLTESEFSAPAMEQLLQFFGQLHEQVLEGATA